MGVLCTGRGLLCCLDNFNRYFLSISLNSVSSAVVLPILTQGNIIFAESGMSATSEVILTILILGNAVFAGNGTKPRVQLPMNPCSAVAYSTLSKFYLPLYLRLWSFGIVKYSRSILGDMSCYTEFLVSKVDEAEILVRQNRNDFDAQI
jgi:hypothetical protein